MVAERTAVHLHLLSIIPATRKQQRVSQMEFETQSPQRGSSQIVNVCSLKGMLQLLTWTLTGNMCKPWSAYKNHRYYLPPGSQPITNWADLGVRGLGVSRITGGWPWPVHDASTVGVVLVQASGAWIVRKSTHISRGDSHFRGTQGLWSNRVPLWAASFTSWPHSSGCRVVGLLPHSW